MTDVDFRPQARRTGDLVLDGGDLLLDEGLITAVMLSMFTDGRAPADEQLPEEGAGRRGWWAQQLREGEAQLGFGSLLWLVHRSKLTDETLNRAQEFASQALDWLIAEDLCEGVEVVASRLDRDTLQLEVELRRGSAQGFPELWAALRDEVIELESTRVKILAR